MTLSSKYQQPAHMWRNRSNEMNLEHRLQMLEQQYIVMQKEISAVLGEMQATTEAMAKMMQVGLRVMDARLNVLEGNPPPKSEEGKEL